MQLTLEPHFRHAYATVIMERRQEQCGRKRKRCLSALPHLVTPPILRRVTCCLRGLLCTTQSIDRSEVGPFGPKCTTTFCKAVESIQINRWPADVQYDSSGKFSPTASFRWRAYFIMSQCEQPTLAVVFRRTFPGENSSCHCLSATGYSVSVSHVSHSRPLKW